MGEGELDEPKRGQEIGGDDFLEDVQRIIGQGRLRAWPEQTGVVDQE